MVDSFPLPEPCIMRGGMLSSPILMASQKAQVSADASLRVCVALHPSSLLCGLEWLSK